jgi:hypothetical protein
MVQPTSVEKNLVPVVSGRSGRKTKLAIATGSEMTPSMMKSLDAQGQ